MQADVLHRRAQFQLQRAVGRASAALLLAVTLDRSERVRAGYAAAQSRIVSAGQRQAAGFAVAYMRSYVEPVRPVNLAAVLGPTLMTPESDGALVGLLRLWSLLDGDQDEATARQDAGSFAANLAEGDCQAAQRVGLDEGARAAGREARWRLEPAPGACAWCQKVAGEGGRFLHADSVPFHGSDHCSVAPEFED